jgi:hypothetical protein
MMKNQVAEASRPDEVRPKRIHSLSRLRSLPVASGS